MKPDANKMKADVRSVRNILEYKRQWVVPVYQRHYEWDSMAPRSSRVAKDAQILKLWETMEDKARENLDGRTKIPHYFGAIICAYIIKEDSDVGFAEKIEYDYLVDGQQRITSFQIALIAIREVAKFYEITSVVDEANKHIFNRKVSDTHSTSRDDFKLRPSKKDRSLFEAIALIGFEKFKKDHEEIFSQPIQEAEKLIQAYYTLYWNIKEMVELQTEEKEHSAEEILSALLEGFLDGFSVVVIRLGKEDDAQEIFTSLNDLGKPLLPFDLVRNDIFLRARKRGVEDWETLHDREWEYFETKFWHEGVRRGRANRLRTEDLIAHVVVAETARQIGISKIATEYKRYAENAGYKSVDEEIKVLEKHAENYRSIEEYTSDHKNEKSVTDLAKVLDILDISIFHPLVLWVCYHVEDGKMQKNIFNLIETFMIRREICGLTDKNYNKLVPSMIGKMRDYDSSVNDPAYTLREYITSLKGNASKMPRDSEVLEAFQRNPKHYSTNSRRVRHILVKLEYAMRKIRFNEIEHLDESNLTLEHIMPQGWAEEWLLPNGKKVESESIFNILNEGLDVETRDMIRTRNEAIYTYGNLTLLTDRLNPDVDNKEWKEKRKAIKKKSRLAMNLEIVEEEVWDEEAIKRRAEELAKLAIDRWKFTPTG